MDSSERDKLFAGSVPKIYGTYLVPLIFEPYAKDLARRVASRSPDRLLEVAAGTGVLTHALASALPTGVSIVATDLNQPMLDEANTIGTERPVEWRQADALQLPFADETFDAVVCQFGVMFFPERARAFSEARRVLRPGGELIYNVWDRIEENEFAETVTDARSRANSFRDPAIAYCQGTPLRGEIEERGATRLGKATDFAAEAIARRFGRKNVDGKMQAHIVAIER